MVRIMGLGVGDLGDLWSGTGTVGGGGVVVCGGRGERQRQEGGGEVRFAWRGVNCCSEQDILRFGHAVAF